MPVSTVAPIVSLSKKITVGGRPNGNAGQVANTVALAGHLKRLSLAVEPDSTRYKLGYVKVEADGEMIRFVSTDGRRLHLLDIPGIIDPIELFLDPKELSKAATAIKGARQAVDMIFEPSGLTVDTGKKKIYIGNDRSDGRWPRYQDVFQPCPEWFEVPAGRLVAMARAFGQDTEGEQGCDFTITGSCLAFGDKKTGLAFLPYSAVRDDEPIKQTAAKLSTSYIIDALDGLPDETTVRVNFKDHKSAFQLVAGNYQAVIMPLTRDR